jgi:hypothetical protein
MLPPAHRHKQTARTNPVDAETRAANAFGPQPQNVMLVEPTLYVLTIVRSTVITDQVDSLAGRRPLFMRFTHAQGPERSKKSTFMRSRRALAKRQRYC